jgi:hypothetical protein
VFDINQYLNKQRLLEADAIKNGKRTFSETTSHQAIAYTREDVLALFWISRCAYGEIRAIRWILTAIALILAMRMFR